jgi:hypothetical protein
MITFFKQLFGTFMGSKPAPFYYNIYLARRIDKALQTILKEAGIAKEFKNLYIPKQ